MRFQGGVMNGVELYVLPCPIVVINVYRPDPAKYNREWQWLYASYIKTDNHYISNGYSDAIGVIKLIKEKELELSDLFEINP